jgi:hypothetical protein
MSEIESRAISLVCPRHALDTRRTSDGCAAAAMLKKRFDPWTELVSNEIGEASVSS